MDDNNRNCNLLLAFDTNSTTTATSGFSALTTDLEAKTVADTTLHSHLLHAFDIVAEVSRKIGGNPVSIIAGSAVEAAVEHPLWNSVIGWVLNDFDESFFFGVGEGTGTAEWIETGLANNGVSESAANTWHSAKSEIEWATAIDVSGEHTDHIAESGWIGNLEGHS